MMTPQVYKQLILNGIQDLSPNLLAEVANFVYFLRKQNEEPDAFTSDQFELLLGKDLQQFDLAEMRHLEEEIADYQQLYPFEQTP